MAFPRTARRTRASRPGLRWSAGTVLARIVSLIGAIFAMFLVLHILLVLLEANPQNDFASFVRDVAEAVSLGLKDLFTPENFKIRTALNFGLAAVLWMVLAGLAERIIYAVTR